MQKYKMPFIIFPTIEKKSIEEWVNIGANMLCFAKILPLSLTLSINYYLFIMRLYQFKNNIKL